MRTYLEQLQEMYFARKADLVADDHWRTMRWLVRGFFGPKIDQLISKASPKWVGSAPNSLSSAATGIWRKLLARHDPVKAQPLE